MCYSFDEVQLSGQHLKQGLVKVTDSDVYKLIVVLCNIPAGKDRQSLV